MYSAPAITPVQAAPKKNAILFSVAGIVCLAISIFLVAATIVLALIPIYTADRSTAADESRFTSKQATLYIPITGSSSSGRRRRQDTDALDTYVGNEAGPKLKTSTASAMKQKMDTSTVEDVLIDKMVLAYKDDDRRKRWALTKRAARDKVFVVYFRIKYRKTKSVQALIAAAANIKQRIIQAFSSNPNITSVDFYIGGNAQNVAIVITFSAPTYISEIVPGSASVVIGTNPTTGRPTRVIGNVTTTPATTVAPLTTPSMVG